MGEYRNGIEMCSECGLNPADLWGMCSMCRSDAPFVYTLYRLPGTVGSYATDAAGGRWYTWHHINVPPLRCDSCGARITRGWARLGSVGMPWLHVCAEHVTLTERAQTV